VLLGADDPVVQEPFHDEVEDYRSDGLGPYAHGVRGFLPGHRLQHELIEFFVTSAGAVGHHHAVVHDVEVTGKDQVSELRRDQTAVQELAADAQLAGERVVDDQEEILGEVAAAHVLRSSELSVGVTVGDGEPRTVTYRHDVDGARANGFPMLIVNARGGSRGALEPPSPQVGPRGLPSRTRPPIGL
jgi:hypothetical protein